MSRRTFYTPPIERFITYAKMFPEDRFDPNVFIITDGLGIITAVGPLGLVYLSAPRLFKIKKYYRKHKIKGKTLYRNNEYGYTAIALHWELPSARIVESVLHPDYYDGMTIKKMTDRITTMLKRFMRKGVKERYAKFFKWFDNAFDHVEKKPFRDIYHTKNHVISSNPKEYGFFPYAFRQIENITLKDYYERQEKDKRS